MFKNATVIRTTGYSSNTYFFTREDGKNVEAWYDANTRLWTVYVVDNPNETGHQAGPAEHTAHKSDVPAIVNLARRYND